MAMILDKNKFYQWDLERTLEIVDNIVTEVHFKKFTDNQLYVCEVYDNNGVRVVDIPNILFTTSEKFTAYFYCNDLFTKQHASFDIIPRPKPTDYVYTETEVKRYDTLEQEIEELNNTVNELNQKIDKTLDIIVDQNYDAKSINPQSGQAVAQAIETKPGEVTITGADYNQSAYASVRGERFNDYDDTNGNRALAAGSHAEGIRSIEYDGLKQTIVQNIAGCGCFEIDSKSVLGSYYYYPNFNTTNKTIIVKGDASAYAAGDVISVITDINFDECATISSVSYNGSDKTTITLQEWPAGLKQGSNNILDSSNVVKSYVPMTLRVVAKPLVGTTYLGLGAHTEGLGSRALADGAHAEGRETKAMGRYSHTEGRETKAHYAAHAEGWETEATGDYAHAEGKTTIASGYTAHSEGDTAKATGKTSHAEGYNTKAEGNMSHAEGNKSQATGYASHAEGDQNIASNNAAHAEGYNTQATGTMSHAEGESNIASANAAHAEGRWTEANHQGSHAGGYATRTGTTYQTVIGKYNKGLNTTLFEVGDGTASTEEGRRNAFEVYTDGHAELRVQGKTDNSVIIKKSLLSVYNELNSKIENSSQPKSHIVLTDNVAGINYKLCINNGKLQLEVVE